MSSDGFGVENDFGDDAIRVAAVVVILREVVVAAVVGHSGGCYMSVFGVKGGGVVFVVAGVDAVAGVVVVAFGKPRWQWPHIDRLHGGEPLAGAQNLHHVNAGCSSYSGGQR